MSRHLIDTDKASRSAHMHAVNERRRKITPSNAEAVYEQIMLRPDIMTNEQAIDFAAAYLRASRSTGFRIIALIGQIYDHHWPKVRASTKYGGTTTGKHWKSSSPIHGNKGRSPWNKGIHLDCRKIHRDKLAQQAAIVKSEMAKDCSFDGIIF